eukprot:CAMPEP_0198256656 /NCGR_PEP_ID=MMETSP1447-20131203/6519_1 /TAXON_ID=420782 /ORGANISM="Chaetoceros dichaeta, Strain CCMP1751" /LENGTH=245 /DNA_ID=CAMNT_0043943351 /DNA_START=25 /DNA_END=762 /DNA_ORIENTATION=-
MSAAINETVGDAPIPTPTPSPTTTAAAADTAVETEASSSHDLVALKKEAASTSLSLESITDGSNDRDIPNVKFLDDIGDFAASFDPPASAELMIGAFSDLFGKFKTFETGLVNKRKLFTQKIPEIEKSLALVTYLKQKHDAEENIMTRYNLADTLFAKAEVNCASGIVHLWLGANVMLEYTYVEAIELLTTKERKAKGDYQEATQDLAFVRNQIITAEVIISRIYNWDVRQKRSKTNSLVKKGGE